MDSFKVPHLQLLADTKDPVSRLAHLLSRPTLALAGSRTASEPFLEIARILGRHAATWSTTLIVGADAGAEEEALGAFLAAGGHAVVVVPGGLDYVSEAENAPLLAKARRTGVVLSFSPPEVEPSSATKRNRAQMMAYMAGAVAIVQASMTSYSLAVATSADRSVYVVPGPFSDPAVAGGNRLIQNGATLLHSPQDLAGAIPSGHMPMIA